MKQETIKAIAETRESIGQLGKSEMNPHGRYKYVSIDAYYEKVATIAARNGLSWVVHEDDFVVIPDVGKTGIIQAKYSITLLHDCGDCIPGFSRLTILHPIQGAQTVGSAVSYLDKVFMRQLFAVATGEKDADADETDPSALDGIEKAKPAPEKAKPVEKKLAAPPGPDDWKVHQQIFDQFLPTCQTEDDLREFWAKNYEARYFLKEHAPDVLEDITSAFSKRKREILKEKQNGN